MKYPGGVVKVSALPVATQPVVGRLEGLEAQLAAVVRRGARARATVDQFRHFMALQTCEI
jgi:hypothetical protein